MGMGMGMGMGMHIPLRRPGATQAPPRSHPGATPVPRRGPGQQGPGPWAGLGCVCDGRLGVSAGGCGERVEGRVACGAEGAERVLSRRPCQGHS